MDQTNFSEIIERLDRIEQSINGKLDPLLDLLQTVVKTGLKKTTNSPEPVEIETPDLIYNSDSDNVYISGKKTYDNRELIKATFKGSSWNKERSAWSFKKFDDYEKTLVDVFPNIIKGQ